MPTMVDVVCTACNKSFKRKLKDYNVAVKNNAKQVCSRKCNYDLQRIERGLTVKCCKRCNEVINSKYEYCALCRSYNKQIVLGYTIAQIKELYKDKTSMAVAAKIRGYGATIYNRSTRPKYCVNCYYSRHYEVCHIRQVKDFPETATMAEVHALDNLIALCPTCHWQLDHGMLDVDTIGVMPPYFVG